jgi:hypothetical protein
MDIPTFNKMMESENLAVKIFSEICCNGCTCKNEKDHITISQQDTSLYQE